MRLTLLSLAMLAAALLPVAANANLLDDGGFEAATGNTQTSNSDWSLVVGMPNGPAAQFQDAPWASNPLGSPGIGMWFRGFEGADGSTGGANATLSQTVAAGPGDYDLIFWVRHETNFAATSANVILSSDQGDSVSFDLLGTANDGAYNQYGITGFVASAGTTELTVQAVMTEGVDAGVNPQSMMLDDFSLTAGIPEPTSVLLALCGLAGLATRRS
ncbi:hypothetical protein MalM25_20140 [Planctomycetes bacterium MalM25]|nr:hypothetical protein MalM25_20140 [Planctomycetes bacterium MalM25]